MSENHNGATILVVESVEETRTLMKELLEMEGYRVLAVADVSSAVEKIQYERPDLILTNQHMQPLDAIFTACHMRERTTEGVDVPIVILLTEERSELKGIDIPLGHDVHVSYLADFGQLQNLLVRILSRGKGAGGKAASAGT